MKKNLFILIASLLLCGSIQAQEYHWSQPNVNNFDGNMSFAAWVTLDGEYIDNTTDIEVAAFVNDQCRMTTYLKDWGDPHPWIWKGIQYLNNELPSSSGPGATVTFKMFDHNTQNEYDICGYTCMMDQDFDIDWDNPDVVTFFTPTFSMEITGYGTNTGGNYYLIASPIGEVHPTAVTNMVAVEDDPNFAFDLYYFDQTQELEWINYKAADGNFNLEVGKGYLYANNNGSTITFTGFPYEETVTVNLVKNDDATLSGWNLVGNPYGVAATIDREFYIMNNAGSELITSEESEIPSMQGIFVMANNDNESMTFNPVTDAKRASVNRVVVNLNEENGNVIDRAIIRFGEGDLLPKFQLNENSTSIYIPQNGVDYAVLNANDESQMPVNFKPAEDGNYTLVVNPQNTDLEYLHLIDNFTGADIDLLAEHKYSFDARVADYASRFILRFRDNSNVNVNEMFCPISYRQDGTLAINGIQGESEIQVVDMLGRVVSSENVNINGDIVRQINTTPGVYVVRLINNNNIYTQKIVVE